MRDQVEAVRDEFTRQAESLAAGVVFNDETILARIREAAALTRQSRVLDVACGPGIVAAALAPDAGEVVACDLTPEMVARAQARCAKAGYANVRCVLGRAEALPFDAACFDAVVCRSALHHFLRPAAALTEMARVLRADGRAVILDVISAEDAEASALHNALENVRDPSHVRMLSRSELYAQLGEAGLEVARAAGWTNHREFEEWLKIVNAPERAQSLRAIMTALAQAGIDAGIGLRLEAGRIRFEHSPLLVVARKQRA